MSNRDLFYCYDLNLARILKYTDGITFITKARHLETGKVFHLFVINDTLQNVLYEYKKCR